MDQLTKGPTSIETGITPAPELSVVVPTYNERDNVPLVVELLKRTLEDVSWEVIFVDDNSPDGTAAAVRALGAADHRVRCIRRIARPGRCLHRGHAVEPGPLHRRARCRPPA